MQRTLALVLVVVVGIFLAGCSTAATNANVPANTNGNNVSSNTGVLTNNNGNKNTSGVRPINGNANDNNRNQKQP